MSLKTWLLPVLALAVGGFIAGCATDGTPKPGAAGATNEVICSADELRVGDLISITFADANPPPVQGLEHKDRVKDDGTIQLPLIGAVKVAGRKKGDVEVEIQKMYVEKGFYKQITTTIRIEDRFFTVGGEVRSPSRQVYVGDMTALRAIQSCGDFTDFANKRRIVIQRANGTREEFDAIKALKDPKFDRKICPGDSISVPRSII